MGVFVCVGLSGVSRNLTELKRQEGPEINNW